MGQHKKDEQKKSKLAEKYSHYSNQAKNATKKFFKVNIIWKIFALGASFLLWLAAVNATDPIRPRPVSRPIEIRGLSQLAQNNIMLLNETTLRSNNIIVEVASRESNFISSEDIVAFIDFSRVENLADIVEYQSITLPIQAEVRNININSGYVLTPQIVSLSAQIDVIETRRIPIELVVRTVPTGNYSYDDMVANHDYIEIIGPVSAIENVTRAVAFIDLESVAGRVSDLIVDVDLLNEHDEKVISQFITRSIESVYIDIEIASLTHVPVIAPSIIGADNVALGTVFTNLSVDMNSVGIFGDADLVATVNSLTLPDINITGMAETYSTVVNLNNMLPNGLTIRGNHLATITINIESIEETNQVTDLLISTNNIEVINQLTEDYNIFIEDYIIARVQGQGIDQDLVTGVIVLPENLNIGTHFVPVETNISPDFLLNPVYVMVIIEDQQEDDSEINQQEENDPEDYNNSENHENYEDIEINSLEELSENQDQNGNPEGETNND